MHELWWRVRRLQAVAAFGARRRGGQRLGGGRLQRPCLGDLLHERLALQQRAPHLSTQAGYVAHGKQQV